MATSQSSSTTTTSVSVSLPGTSSTPNPNPSTSTQPAVPMDYTELCDHGNNAMECSECDEMLLAGVSSAKICQHGNFEGYCMDCEEDLTDYIPALQYCQHGEVEIFCSECNNEMVTAFMDDSAASSSFDQYREQTSVNGLLRAFSYEPTNKAIDIPTLLRQQKKNIIKLVNEQLVRFNGVKWYIAVKVELFKTVNNMEVTSTPFFHGRLRQLLRGDDINTQYSEAVQKIMESMAKYLQEGSGWRLRSVLKLDLCTVKYEPLYASSYIPTPKELQNSMKGIINVQNKDNKCFLWSVLAALYPAENHKNRYTNYKPYVNNVNMTGISYPVKVDDIDKFEELNPNIAINVYVFVNRKVMPHRISQFQGRQQIDLLLLTNNEGNSHYCYIQNINKLIRPTLATIPKKLSASMKSVVNIEDLDNKSFLWCILASLHGDDGHGHYRLNQYFDREKDINMTGIEYPVHYTKLDKFEKLNPTLSVNVFGFEDEKVFPIRITTNKNRLHTDLLLSSCTGKIQYSLINNLDHFLAHLTKFGGHSYYCRYCLHRFSDEGLLKRHVPYCKPHGAQRTQFPSEDKKDMYFTNYTLCHKVPFTIYADFESYAVPISTVLNTTSTSSTTDVSRHEPSGYCYIIIDAKGKIYKGPVTYTGDNVVKRFLDELLSIADKELLPIINHDVGKIITDETKLKFKNATVCHLCEKPFTDKKNYKVWNHNHQTGEYLGAAHNECNMNYKVPKHIPVFFHNLKGYDAHHLMSEFGNYTKDEISCIASSSEKYISFSLNSLRFLDSLQFLNASLDTLVSNLSKQDTEAFAILKEYHSQHGRGDISLLLRKGVFPYDYLTGPSVLEEKELPPPEAFFNNLTNTSISKEDYDHAQNIWNEYGMSTFKDYHDLYLTTDVLLLADVFENFRSTSMKYYSLDPCNCYSAPGLSWNAMLKMTEVKLELLTDPDQHLFIEKGIRGGVAMIPTRHAVANNPLVGYTPSKPTSYIMYLDCNNLYGTAMSQPLPHSDFKWLSENEINNLDVLNVADDNDIGYILEVDLEYPQSLHKLHKDYPLAPEKQIVTQEMLSPFSRQLQNVLDIKSGKVEKLLTTVYDKENYVIHYRNLKFYIEQGLKLKKVHRVLSFKQSPWLKKFIDFNTAKRQAAKNNFEKDFFKLLNNATYGKSLENVRSHIDFHLVNNEKQLIKLTSSPRMKNIVRYNDMLCGVTMKKQVAHLNKPLYVGFCVLDISKLIMYQFHYSWAKAKYGDNIKLCMTDTDSLLYHVTTEDIYKDMKANLDLFDTSDYPPEHECYSPKNKKVLGKFKDELNSIPIKEFVGLRAKCYSILDRTQHEKRVAKGVPRVAIKDQLQHEDYKDCLTAFKLKMTTAFNIRSNLHQLYTKRICKLSLSPYDDKRYILEDGVNTLPYGYRQSVSRKRKMDKMPSTCMAKRQVSSTVAGEE